MYLTIDNEAKKVESSPKKIGRNCPPPNALCSPPMQSLGFKNTTKDISWVWIL